MNKQLPSLAARVVAGIEDSLLLPGNRKRRLAEQVLRSFCNDLSAAELTWAIEDAVLRVKRPPLWRLRRGLLCLIHRKDVWRRGRISGHADLQHPLAPHPRPLLQQ